MHIPVSLQAIGGSHGTGLLPSEPRDTRVPAEAEPLRGSTDDCKSIAVRIGIVQDTTRSLTAV